jgi:large subunit ribosomal protein L3
MTSSKFILGTKQGMTQVWDADGAARAATVISAGPVVVTQVKTKDTDGYTAVQVGYGTRKEKNVAKPQLGHYKELGAFMVAREVRGMEGKERGAALDVSQFAVGDMVTISGISKGKGWQGVVKRYGFAGDMATHGRSHSLRMPGSLGGGGRAGGRVAKGKRMGGRMGGDRVTVKGLTVLQIDVPSNTLVVSGAVPGVKGCLLEIASN